MIKAIVSDFSRTLLFPKDENYQGSLNELYKSVKEKPGFSFFDNFVWNKQLASFYEKQLDNKIDLYIFTTETIQEDPAVLPFTQSIFKDVLNVKALGGTPKDDPETYKQLAKKIGVNPEEIAFVDDSDVNISAAKQAGLNTITYKNVAQVETDFIKLFL
jgi:HAD superfamily hydrolase (TIGR01509 family)